ncbi:ceramidase domain-containing protein [Nocardioides lijunqiniae]|uniref:ceramidase domain-containing protein n=1 Tax=Nocardioides lijunqiniae TaxID=2760832 RepID=UPI001877E2A2
MDWTQAIDSYCERTDASYWSEPLNAVSNVSFIVAALVTWRMARTASDKSAQVLALGAGGIGVGSYLFHTHATRWAMHADVWPIRIFVVLFLGVAVVRFFGTPRWVGIAAAAGFVVATAATIELSRSVGTTFNGSVGYAPVPVAMVLMAALVARRDRRTAVNLVAIAATFVASLALRTVDRELCAGVPFGTHFGWHLLNGVVSGLMIVVFIGRGQGGAGTHTRNEGRELAEQLG